MRLALFADFGSLARGSVRVAFLSAEVSFPVPPAAQAFATTDGHIQFLYGCCMSGGLTQPSTPRPKAQDTACLVGRSPVQRKHSFV
jgi:hypothetical protein